MNIVSNYWFWGGTGFFIGAVLAVFNLVRNKCGFTSSVISVTIGVYFGALGTRLLYILIFYPQLFIENPVLAMAFWQETGTWLGGPIFGGIAFMICMKIVKEPVMSNLGSMVPGLVLAHAIARVGCLVGGCCFGAPTNVPWAIYSDHLQTMVHPTQVYSIIGELTALVILQKLWKTVDYRKYLFPLYGILLSIHRFISEMFRGSEAGPELIPGLRIFQVVCLGIFLVSVCWFLILRWKKRGVVSSMGIAAVSIFALFIVNTRSHQESTAQNEDSNSKIYLVVTRNHFAGLLDDWIAKRTKDGYQVIVRGWRAPPSVDDIKNWIREKKNQYQNKPIGNILIIGDYGENNATSWFIPSIDYDDYLTKDTRAFTDILYGDINDDGYPEIPVGRLPVQNSIQLKTYLNKIVGYEQQPLLPAWFRVNVWVGGLGFTEQMDTITLDQIEHIPKWLDQFIISAHHSSPYSGYIPDQPAVFLDQFNRPSFLSLVASHGSFRDITTTVFNGQKINLTVEDVARIQSSNPTGLLFLLSCNSGQFNMPLTDGLSLSEALANHPGGPIGVVASTGTSHPLTNYFVIERIMALFEQKPETIGNLLLKIQQNLFKNGENSFKRLILSNNSAESLALGLPKRDRPSLFVPGMLRKNILLYNLMGDPAVKLNFPGNIKLGVTNYQKNVLTLSGKTATDCDKLYVDLMSVKSKKSTLEAKSTVVRREVFKRINSKPRFLMSKTITGKEWKVKIHLPPEDKGQNKLLRFIAIGQLNSYTGTFDIRNIKS